MANAYLALAWERFGIKPIVQETAGTETAETQLRAALADHGPCVAWVAGYHVVSVYRIEDDDVVVLRVLRDSRDIAALFSE